MDRFYKTALKFKAKNILRITGDCPIVDPVMVDKFIEKFDLLKPDYLSNTIKPTYPDGLDLEIFNLILLKKRGKIVKINMIENMYTIYD